MAFQSKASHQRTTKVAAFLISSLTRFVIAKFRQFEAPELNPLREKASEIRILAWVVEIRKVMSGKGKKKKKKKKHTYMNMADQVKYLRGSSALPRKRCWDDGGCWIVEEMKNSENLILLLQLICLNAQWNEMCVIDNITRRNGTQL